MCTFEMLQIKFRTTGKHGEDMLKQEHKIYTKVCLECSQ
jgi:hypothetical protein